MAEQSLQIKRNKNIFDTKEAAVNHLNSLVDKLQDGEIVLCRYFNGETIQTLIGFETKYNINNEETQEPQTISAIAYLDSFSEVGMGLLRDEKGVLQLNFGNGLNINEGKIDVKINNNITNFLHIDTEGLIVDEMGANVTKTTEPILVMGGPLATSAVQAVLPKTEDEYQIPYIAANTNLQELLVRLFCNEIYPLISSENLIQGNVTAIINPPLLTLSQTATTLEVGTYISATTISFNGNSKASYKPSIVSGLTYGYSLTNDNIKDSSDTIIIQNPTTGIITTAITQMACELTGFTKTKFQTITGNTVLSANTLNLGQIIEGENKIEISLTGQPITYSIEEIKSVYPCSNIGNTSDVHITSTVDAINGITTSPINATTITKIGVRYGYYGIIIDDPNVSGQEEFTYNSNAFRGLNPLISKKDFTITGDNVGRVIIAIPKSWNAEIKEIRDAEQMNNDLLGSSTGYLKKSTAYQIEGANGYAAADYDVYEFNPNNPVKINQTVKFE